MIDLGAKVSVVDSHISPQSLPDGAVEIDLTAETVESAEAVVVLVDHDDVDIDLIATHASYVLDCRDVIDAISHDSSIEKL